MPTSLSPITGIRLEVLEDPSLPFNGPGRQPTNGNFVLTELMLHAEELRRRPARHRRRRRRRDRARSPTRCSFCATQFGFTGGGADLPARSADECTRCDERSPSRPTSTQLGSKLDIDGDGSVEPLTDALLILRYAFGFRGTTLTVGATDPQCTRCDAFVIEAYLACLFS